MSRHHKDRCFGKCTTEFDILSHWPTAPGYGLGIGRRGITGVTENAENYLLQISFKKIDRVYLVWIWNHGHPELSFALYVHINIFTQILPPTTTPFPFHPSDESSGYWTLEYPNLSQTCELHLNPHVSATVLVKASSPSLACSLF